MRVVGEKDGRGDETGDRLSTRLNIASPLDKSAPFVLYFEQVLPRKMQPVILDRALNETQDDNLSKTDNFV